MEITLNHTIIPAKNKFESAKWYEEVFGFEYIKDWGPFSVVRVNKTLSLDFKNMEGELPFLHFAFKVDDQQFDTILGRLQEKGILYNSSPGRLTRDDQFDMKINHLYGGKGVYFNDPNGHNLEILTADYDLGE